MTALWLVLPLLTQKGPDPEDVKPGWLGFGMFLLLAVAVVLLWLSFRKQLRKIDFEEAPDGRGTPGRPNGGPDATDEGPTRSGPA